MPRTPPGGGGPAPGPQAQVPVDIGSQVTRFVRLSGNRPPAELQQGEDNPDRVTAGPGATGLRQPPPILLKGSWSPKQAKDLQWSTSEGASPDVRGAIPPGNPGLGRPVFSLVDAGRVSVHAVRANAKRD